MADQSALIQKLYVRIEDIEQELRIVHRQLQQFQQTTMQFYREQYELKHGPTAYRPTTEDSDGFDKLDSQ